jgi:hypothetical protein
MAAIMRQRGEVYAPPRYDAYIVLLVISLVAMILGCALLWADYSAYPDTKPQAVSAHQPAPPAAGAPAPAPQQGAPPQPAPPKDGAPPAPAPK